MREELSAGMNPTPHTKFQDSFAEEVWRSTYKYHEDETIDDTLKRVARAIASVEETDELKEKWTNKFYDMLSEFKALPGGRTIANAGAEFNGTTLANCFVSPRRNYDIDSIEGILEDVLNQCQTLKSEGGWGQNFSFIRPRGAFIHGIGVETPGAIKYMEIYDKTSDIITSGSGTKSKNKKAKGKIRKGAMMAILDDWHPDVEEFIRAKQTPGRLTKFNVSVNFSDLFMQKLLRIREIDNKLERNDFTSKTEANKLQEEKDEHDKWYLRFPDTTADCYEKDWDGDIVKWENAGNPVKIYKTVSITGLWNMVMESTYQRAEPGVIFLDRGNYFNPLNYKEKIVSTNPSMPAGTLVHTKKGIFPIDKLEGNKFKVKSLDGKWSEAECRKSGENKPLLEISFGKNRTIKSTTEHRWPVLDTRMQRIYKADAKDLKIGDLIPLNRNENIGIYGDMSLTEEEGFLIGYLIGDGWFIRRGDNDNLQAGFTFGNHEGILAEKIINIVNNLKPIGAAPSNISERESGELTFSFSNGKLMDDFIHRYKLIPHNKDIPESVWKGNDRYIKGFVDGLLSADGHVYIDKKRSSQAVNRIILTTSRENLAKNFAKLLSFAGINCNISSASRPSSFPNGKDYEKIYARWDVHIDGKNIQNFCNVFDISHPEKHEKLEDALGIVANFSKDNYKSRYVRVISVKEAKNEDVWDISVFHNQHVFPTEWSYTGNCGEQQLSSGNICTLGTLNLTQFVLSNASGFNLDKIKKYVHYLVRFLDNVNTYSNAPLPEYKESMMKKRRIGIGVMGWGSSLFMMKIRFGSNEADRIREEMISTIARESYIASIDLAEEKGMFEYCDPKKHAEGAFISNLQLEEDDMKRLKKYGIRNASLLSCQPNGNTGIYSNVVSGGIEPIFMPEYTRTVIVNEMPNEIAKITPKWYEGEWHETKLFKFEKEGDEEILKGKYKGTTYKIDKNRGLTKEVICQDYGVRWLEERGQWEPDADWAVTTTNLDVKDHIKDLKGFARWVDSSISKTINVPYEYPFEDFKNIYLDAYSSGYIKGITTYRAGTMTSVLSAKEEKDAAPEDEEIILEDFEVPTKAPAVVSTIRAEGKKWYLTTIMDEDQKRPIAFFCNTNHHEKSPQTLDAVDRLLNLAEKKGIPSKWIEDTANKMGSDNNSTKIARCISLNLRHGVLIRNVVGILNDIEDVFVGSFLFQIRKHLMSWIKDGEPVTNGNGGATCIECGGAMRYESGCSVCSECGNSKCG